MTVRCEELEGAIVEGARGGPADAAERERVSRHVASCARCARAAVEQASLGAALARLAAATATAHAPPSLEARLREALPAPAARARTGAPSHAAWLGAGVAAALLAALLGRGPRTPSPVTAPAAIAGSPVARTDSPAAAGPSDDRRVVASAPMPRPAAHRRRPSPHRTEPAGERATAFERLPYAASLPDTASVQVVRVQLSRAALVRYGWPAVDAMDARTVSADVVVGDDGFARAIRFVAPR